MTYTDIIELIRAAQILKIMYDNGSTQDIATAERALLKKIKDNNGLKTK